MIQQSIEASPNTPTFPWRDNFEILAESIDTLTTVEMTAIGPGRGIVRPLYDAAVEAQGGSPILIAARRLVEVVEPGSTVVLSTGIVIPDFMPVGESDGPPGIAALCSILSHGLGALPVILCERETAGPIRDTVEALGLPVRSYDSAQRLATAVVIEEFTEDPACAPEEARQLLDRLSPSAIVTSEKLGVNQAGVTHTSTGKRLDAKRLRIETLIEAAQARGIYTVAIGDNGNEVGFGLIADAVREHKPFGRVCQCECERGLACVNATDNLIVATVSNWGCYGLTAMIAGLIDRVDLIPCREEVHRMIDACVRAGGIDGATAMQSMSVDGIPSDVEESMVEMLRVIVSMGLRRRPARPF
ncbi:MAG: DUF4392 domain-containing protein [Thermomicrobiales bacterium]|nr:DUF4392 domain-containing protein [Thermomicrobiales bacterium]